MKYIKIITALALALSLGPTNGMGSPHMNNPATLPSVIPAPASWEPGGGEFSLAGLERIIVGDGTREIEELARASAVRLKSGLGRTLPVQVAGVGNHPEGSLVFTAEAGLAPEAYELRITDRNIEIAAAEPAGFRHGVTTLLQLAVNGQVFVAPTTLPGGIIRDEPRFAWRGMLLDCGRHFMPVSKVKEVIDRLALHKFNVLHWHLTEDQGWRLEIDGYPRLTQVGAWRTDTDGSRYGGFYTAEDVQEILTYAAERSITVVPEIEMPGHCQAALAAYPELSCTGGPFEVQTQWGIHEDVYCAGREETFPFLENVLDRVMEMFPGRYIHIGGDEVPKDRWRECEHCQARIRDEGLADEEDLQSWFIARIAQYLADHGRQLIGWDEILSGGLPGEPAGYTVQAWRGLDQAAEAARAGHGVIVSPTSHAYFDYDPGVLDLQKVHSFRPVPEGLDEGESARILGGQMNLWTEYIPPAKVDAMLFPRLTAMAEALWTGDGRRDFAEFLDRLEGHRPVLEWAGIHSGPSARPVVLGRRDDGGLEASLDPRVGEALKGRSLIIRHLLLRSPFPPTFGPDRMPEDQDLPAVVFSDAEMPGILELPAGNDPGRSWLAVAQLFVDRRSYGAPALLEIARHYGVGAEITFAQPPSPRYPGGGSDGLVDGLHGSRYFLDGLWAGFEGHDLAASLDLGATRELRRISVRFLQDANAWVFLPRTVRFEYSSDGNNWLPAGTASHKVSDKLQVKVIHEYVGEFDTASARYVRVVAENPGVCPDWHPGRGQVSWIFADEIVVQ
jgi:hexosaminidase